MPLPSSPLDPELLYLFVLGPGTGETVLLRIPPDKWVIIDSYMNAGRPASEAVVDEFGGEIAAIVLTHPHEDHCMGFIELIDENENAVIGCVHPLEGTEGAGVPTDPMELLNQRRKPTYVRIWDEWKTAASRKWYTFRHNRLNVGNGSLISLHPVRPLQATDWRGSARNDMSSAMRLVWHDVTLLLGADVTNTAWPDIGAAFTDLAEHSALKVPHHASSEAIHDSYGRGDRNRLWIITPWALGRGLPQADDDHGLAKALKYVDTIQLTSLPFSHNCDSESPCTTTRADLQSDSRPTRTGPVTNDADVRADRYVALAFDKDGTFRGRWNGAGTLDVKE